MFVSFFKKDLDENSNILKYKKITTNPPNKPLRINALKKKLCGAIAKLLSYKIGPPNNRLSMTN